MTKKATGSDLGAFGDDAPFEESRDMEEHLGCQRRMKRKVVLEEGSHPTRCSATTDTERIHRKTNCRRYEFCLDYAQVSAWPNFHCKACSVEEYVAPEIRTRKQGDSKGIFRVK